MSRNDTNIVCCSFLNLTFKLLNNLIFKLLNFRLSITTLNWFLCQPAEALLQHFLYFCKMGNEFCCPPHEPSDLYASWLLYIQCGYTHRQLLHTFTLLHVQPFCDVAQLQNIQC